MKYILPNNEIIDLGEYTLDALEQYEPDEVSQAEMSEMLFNQSGIIIGS